MKKRDYPATRATPTPMPWPEIAEAAAAGMTARQIVDSLSLPCAPGALKFNAARRGISIRAATRREVTASVEASRGVWAPEREAEMRRRLAAGEAYGAIARALGTTDWSVRAKAARMGLRRPAPACLPAVSATPGEAARTTRLPPCLPVPKVSGPLLPAIAALLEAA